MTELAIKELTFDAKVNTSIELENEETLNKLVTEIENKYSKMVYTDNNEKEAKQDKAELNKVIKQIEDERKKVKKVYNEPLSEFEKNMKSYVKRIQDVIAPIDLGIKDLDKRQRDARRDEIIAFIEETAQNYNLEVSEVTIEDNWLNKSHSNIQRTKLITDAMKFINIKKETEQRETAVVEAYCNALTLDADPWILMLKNGNTSVEIIKMIDTSLANKATEAEKNRQIEKQKEVETKQQEQPKKEVEAEVSEVVHDDKQTLILKFRATEEQLDMLNDFIISNGIEVEQI